MLSYKLLLVRICVALSIFCLFIASSYHWGLWVNQYRRWPFPQGLSEFWTLYWLSALLLIVAGVLLGILPEVFFNLKNVGFRPVEFIISAIIPIFVLILIPLTTTNTPLYVAVRSLVGYTNLFSFYSVGQLASSIWIGVAIGKAIHIRQ
jgi:hypothetical protein